MNSQEKIIIFKTEDSDLTEISCLHKNLFKEDHFTANFNGILLLSYLESLNIYSDYSFVARSCENNKVVGYLFAGEKISEGLKVFVKKNWLKILLIILLHPRFWIEKISDLFSMFFSKQQKTSYPLRLFLIAACSDRRIGGVGTELINYFEQHLKNEGKNEYGLSVRKENLRAMDFYQKINMKIEFITKKSVYFYKELS